MKPSPLRETLLGLGLGQRDLSEALSESRSLVRAVSHWAHLGARGLGHVMGSPKVPPKVKVAAGRVGLALHSVGNGADHMLGKRR